MSYFDFPHTRNYDTDLGYLIKKYQELLESNTNLIDLYKSIKNDIAVLLAQMLSDGVISLNANYDKDDEKISFKFDTTALDTHYYTSDDESLNIKLSYLEEHGLVETDDEHTYSNNTLSITDKEDK